MPEIDRRDVRTYNTPGVVNGNLAHDLRTRELEQQLERSGQLDFDKQYREIEETRADKLSRERQATRASVRQAQSVPVTALLGSAVVAVLAVLVVSCHVKINEISGNIVSMKQEIGQLEMEQIALQTQYEQVFDLATVKEAAEAAGMRQPGEGQIYYVDLPGEDQAVAYGTAEKKSDENFFTKLGEHFRAVLEYFS